MLKSCQILLVLGLNAAMLAGDQISIAHRGESARANASEVRDISFTKDNFNDRVSGTELVNALRSGGHVIFIRHAQTEKDYADQADPNLDVNDCSTQRTLSETGWQDARLIGAAFERLNIPVGKVYSSQYCRAWQTADLAFGQYEKIPGLNFAPAEEYTDAQIAQMKAAIEPLLSEMPNPGTNTVVVGHDDVFESATGIYPEPQGIAFIIKPNGRGRFEILANLTPDEWALLK